MILYFPKLVDFANIYLKHISLFIVDFADFKAFIHTNSIIYYLCISMI